MALTNNIQTTPLLQAALSHYRAQRDKCLAELDICLNKPISSNTNYSSPVEQVINLFAALNNADSIIETIEGIILANQPVAFPVDATQENLTTEENKQ